MIVTIDIHLKQSCTS